MFQIQKNSGVARLGKCTYEKWHFPNVYGQIDGRHLALFHPHDSASEFYNYK